MTEHISSPDQAQKTRSRKTLLLVLMAFIVPVILAKLALEQDWFNRASTNKGTLLTPTLDLSELLSERAPKWRLLYVIPSECDAVCENALYSLQQVWLALGRETDRVEALTLSLDTSDQRAVKSVDAAPNIQRQPVMNENVNKLFNGVGSDGIFIVDTQNNAMLHFNVVADKEQAVMESRDILSDIKKLLKLSRIG
ncbi:hypothetical protein [Alteromonas sp. CYL-A6]|uniref:hypothetical protein n=1 Tax=Alteromonas nitratireducens TaxID=3390813 RepID=UPI0034B17E44